MVRLSEFLFLFVCTLCIVSVMFESACTLYIVVVMFESACTKL